MSNRKLSNRVRHFKAVAIREGLPTGKVSKRDLSVLTNDDWQLLYALCKATVKELARQRRQTEGSVK